MTNVFAVHSVGDSLRTYLDQTYPATLRAVAPCTFQLVSSFDMTDVAEMDNTLTIYLYRITMNEHFRNASRRTGPVQENTPLSVDLHYLLTTWSRSPFIEQTTMAWTMRELQQHPVLDRSSLSPDAEWDAGEFIQIIPSELSNEDLMRIWDALEPPYRLSVSYVGRVIRVDTDPMPVGQPVVAARFPFDDQVQP